MNKTVSVCIYKRTRKSKTERGIMIGEGELIIDKNNKPVKLRYGATQYCGMKERYP